MQVCAQAGYVFFFFVLFCLLPIFPRWRGIIKTLHLACWIICWNLWRPERGRRRMEAANSPTQMVQIQGISCMALYSLYGKQKEQFLFHTPIDSEEEVEGQITKGANDAQKNHRRRRKRVVWGWGVGGRAKMLNYYLPYIWLHFKGVLFCSVGLNLHTERGLKLRCDSAAGSQEEAEEETSRAWGSGLQRVDTVLHCSV